MKAERVLENGAQEGGLLVDPKVGLFRYGIGAAAAASAATDTVHDCVIGVVVIEGEGAWLVNVRLVESEAEDGAGGVALRRG